MNILKKTYHIHRSGCPYLEITIIPKKLWIRYYHETTKNFVVYFMMNLRNKMEGI